MNEIDELPKRWVWTRVGEIYDIVGGGTPSTNIQEYWKGDIAWITSADIYGLKDIQPRKRITKAAIENSATNLVPEGSLIVVTRVGLGKVALTKIPLCFSQDSQALIGNSSSIYPDYSLYYLSQAAQVFRYQNRGTTIAGVTKKQLSELPFALPPFAEQQRIVAEIEKQFTRLDAGVAALRQVQAKLKRYRAAVLKAAVEGKLTEAWRAKHPASETTSMLLERILAERKAKWEADLRAKGKDPAKVRYVEPAKPDVEGLPELPEGWCWATVEQLGDVGTGATPLRSRKEYYEGGVIPWVTSGALNSDVVTQAEEFITTKALEETNAKVFPIGTLLLAMYGEGKTRGKVSELRIDAATNQACAAIVFRPASMMCQPYVKYFLLSNYFEIRRLSSGGVQPNLNLSIVKETVIPLPPLGEQEQIVAEVERRLSIVGELETIVEANLKRAERLRPSILREAFAGRLVPQDPNDEPASVLLERIRREREERKMGNRGNGRFVSATEPVKIDVEEMEQVELWEGVVGGE